MVEKLVKQNDFPSGIITENLKSCITQLWTLSIIFRLVRAGT